MINQTFSATGATTDKLVCDGLFAVSFAPESGSVTFTAQVRWALDPSADTTFYVIEEFTTEGGKVFTARMPFQCPFDVNVSALSGGNLTVLMRRS